MKKFLSVLAVMLCMFSNAYSAEQKVAHVVMIWLNDGLTEQQVSDIIEKTNVLSEIDVVKDLKIGRPVPSEKKAVDSSFTFAISMNFDNHKELQQYMVDHIHHDYVQSVLKPALKKVVIYDFK